EWARVVKASYDARKQSQAADADTALRMLAVLERPRDWTTRVLDALSQRSDTSLTALYGERNGAAPEGHTNWFPRSIRLPRRRNYPINWAIVNSFRGLTPHCMLVFGWRTFATQAAIAWCR